MAGLIRPGSGWPLMGALTASRALPEPRPSPPPPAPAGPALASLSEVASALLQRGSGCSDSRGPGSLPALLLTPRPLSLMPLPLPLPRKTPHKSGPVLRFDSPMWSATTPSSTPSLLPSLPTFLPSLSKGLLSTQVSDSEQGAWGQSQPPVHPTELAFQWRGVGETHRNRYSVTKRKQGEWQRTPAGEDWSRAPPQHGKGCMEVRKGGGPPVSRVPLPPCPFFPLGHSWGPLCLLQPLTCPFSNGPGSSYKAQTSSRPSPRERLFPAPKALACVSGLSPAPRTTVCWPRSGPLC